MTARVIQLKRPEPSRDGYCTIPQDARDSFATLSALFHNIQRTFSGPSTRTEQLAFAKANLLCVSQLAKIIEKALP